MPTDDGLGPEVAFEGDLPPSRHGGNRILDLSQLESQDLAALRAKWAQSYGVAPLPRLSRELLIRGIAYRMQERARGGPSRSTLRKLEQIARGDAKAGASNALDYRPGTRLVRAWQGRTYEVVITNDGYLWSGNTYRSLSEVARLITGTQWSGPRFFGLKQAKARSGAND